MKYIVGHCDTRQVEFVRYNNKTSWEKIYTPTLASWRRLMRLVQYGTDREKSMDHNSTVTLHPWGWVVFA